MDGSFSKSKIRVLIFNIAGEKKKKKKDSSNRAKQNPEKTKTRWEEKESKESIIEENEMNACNRRAKPADHKNKGLQALNFCFDVRKEEIEGLAYENQTRPDHAPPFLFPNRNPNYSLYAYIVIPHDNRVPKEP